MNLALVLLCPAAAMALGGPHESLHGVQVCGNYCGFNWCNGKILNEGKCDMSSPPSSQTDACCRLHDFCCGQNNTTPCNLMFLDCLSKLSAADLACTRPASIPFTPDIRVSP